MQSWIIYVSIPIALVQSILSSVWEDCTEKDTIFQTVQMYETCKALNGH